MSENDQNKHIEDSSETQSSSDQEPHKNDARFDMYHFFSRKDVVLAVIVLLAMILYLIWSHLFAPVPA